MKRVIHARMIGGCLAMMAVTAQAPLATAAIRAPYIIDANTLHLWHLDDGGTTAVDAAHYAYAGTFTNLPDANRPLVALFGGATLGAPSFTGYGTALDMGAGANTAGLGALAPANDTTDNVDHTFDHPTTHAFTMEAIIKIGFDPTVALSTFQEIVAGEGDAGDSSDRSWQFRIQANTTPGTTPWVLRFQKVSGFGGVGGSTANDNLDANIPNTGVNAIAQNQWYHVAATYNGNLSDPASLKLYWTKLDASNTSASLIGSKNMNGWLRQQDTDFALGNELRDFNGNTEGYFGLIDEVRISDVERTPSQFIFADPAPGDVNGDFAVNIADFNIITANMLKISAVRADGDLNSDGVVNFADFRVWKLNKTSPPGNVSIPEPAAGALAAASLLGLCGLRLVGLGRRTSK